MEKLIEVCNVSKIYKSKGGKEIKAVDNVSLSLFSGEIYGLLGPNGAGKSTMLKMMLGLTVPDSGQIYIDGFNIVTDRKKAFKSIGGMIETPAFSPSLSAKQNLIYLAKYQTNVSEEDILETLELVGLSDRSDDKFSKFSLGMKQRLALAQAIMHRPKILLLDEPTNGMDPNWIILIRDLLKQIVQERGVSILISSHILGEMQLLCDRFGVINHGVLVKETSKAELEGTISGQSLEVKISCDEVSKAVMLLRNLDFINGINVNPKTGDINVGTKKDYIPNIINVLVNERINIFEITPIRLSVEELFNSATRVEDKNA